MQKRYKIPLIILGILLVFILHQSFILKIDWRFNFWPVLLTFILFLFGSKIALFWGVGLGFLLDSTSILPFGTHLFLLFLIILILHFLTQSLLTIRSVLSVFILTLISTLFYNGFIYLVYKILIRFGNLTEVLTINLNTILVQLLSNLLLIFILFISTLYLTRRLHTNLVVKK